ncbi:MAG: HDOD domain-containing protein [Candidatus Latescibacteria bacterium]|nr:HDOD domain-containing protein [Candidatus Latescibacterota bacterium]
MIKFEEILKKIEYLPPLPVVVSKALSKLNDPKATPDDLAEIIKFDQAVTANVLRLCNSSYFGLRRTITDINEALIYIGLVRFREILVLSGTGQYFEQKVSGYELNKGELWSYSLSSAVIADEICNIIEREDNGSVFLAALLHDIGKVVLSEFVTETWDEIRSKVEGEGYTFIEAEKEVIGYDHAELGARILKLWGFSDEIINAVKKHHEPAQKNDSFIEDIVRISDNLSMMMGYTTSIDGLAYHGYEDICRKYNIHQETLDRIMGISVEKIKKIETEYGISREVA